MKNKTIILVLLSFIIYAFSASILSCKENKTETQNKLTRINSTYKMISIKTTEQAQIQKNIKVFSTYSVKKLQPQINELKLSNFGILVKIYPLPATDMIHLNIPVQEEIKADIEIFSIEGLKVKELSLILNNNQSNIDMDISDLISGYYFVNVESSSFRFNCPLIINK